MQENRSEIIFGYFDPPHMNTQWGRVLRKKRVFQCFSACILCDGTLETYFLDFLGVPILNGDQLQLKLLRLPCCWMSKLVSQDALPSQTKISSI